MTFFYKTHILMVLMNSIILILYLGFVYELLIENHYVLEISLKADKLCRRINQKYLKID